MVLHPSAFCGLDEAEDGFGDSGAYDSSSVVTHQHERAEAVRLVNCANCSAVRTEFACESETFDRIVNSNDRGVRVRIEDAEHGSWVRAHKCSAGGGGEESSEVGCSSVSRSDVAFAAGEE